MKRLLIIGYVWPEPTSSAAGSRMMQLIKLFLVRNYEVIYASPARASEYAINFEELGITKKKITANSSDFDTYVKELSPQVVMFDRFMMEEQFGWRVAENCPHAIRILDTEDLHFFRKARYEALKKRRTLVREDLHSDEAKREIASILRCDLSLIISEAEVDLLARKFKVNPSILHYIPLLAPSISEEKIKKLPTYEKRKDFVFIGNFLHQPNWDSVLYLKEKIWPLIRKELPKARLLIYGAYASQKVEQLQNKHQGFIIKGRAEDAQNVLKKARVLLAPLRFGAGIKGKFIDAMLAGTPSITTTIGAEGICGKYQWPGEIANEEKAIVEEAIKIYDKPKRWQKVQQNGFQIINERFQENRFAEQFFEELENIQQDLEKHRNQNFLGAMLMHHTLQSTKYMSKWIEAKNKLEQQ